VLRNFVLYLSGLRAARLIHTAAIGAVCASPMSFFEQVPPVSNSCSSPAFSLTNLAPSLTFFAQNPLGRLLNRFQNDQQQVDWQLVNQVRGPITPPPLITPVPTRDLAVISP
jgi:hypothetical protein